ncbi:MAG TPA: hypothetical protein VKA34_06370 [Balneolales bacterium]|nr:hypothetical protein [Balneolales bacterium]
MPELARLDAPGALHHIIFRGIERCKIFRENKGGIISLIVLEMFYPIPERLATPGR